MKTFQIGKNIFIVCDCEGTRYGFRHLATLLIDGQEAGRSKACYYNRTWERFEFETVINSLLEKTDALSKAQKARAMRKISGEDKIKTDTQFKNIAMIAKLGEFFGKDQKEVNDWKTRMIQAGLGDRGLIMPEDWDQLEEDEKTKRLDLVIKELA